MDSIILKSSARDEKLALTNHAPNVIAMLSILLADVTNDVEVAARDLALSDASFIRLRRARDRVACAQTLLETVSETAGKTADAAGTSPTGGEAERDLGTIIAAAMREAVELLAREWPEEYPVGAVECLLAASSGRAQCHLPRNLVGRQGAASVDSRLQ